MTKGPGPPSCWRTSNVAERAPEKIGRLVYLAAFAPDANEVAAAFLGQYPSLLGTALVPDAAGYLYVDRSKFREVFAGFDVDTVAAPWSARVLTESRDALKALGPGP